MYFAVNTVATVKDLKTCISLSIYFISLSIFWGPHLVDKVKDTFGGSKGVINLGAVKYQIDVPRR